MSIERVFLTRYVSDHQPARDWYATLFGREADRAPVENCREWVVAPGIIFQVIAQPERRGSVEFAFGVADLSAERSRLEESGLSEAEAFAVQPFDGLTFVGYDDPEGVRTGLLNTEAIADQTATPDT